MNVQELFEKLYREGSTLPAFMVDDALIKGADGEYWHIQTRNAYKWFVIGVNQNGQS